MKKVLYEKLLLPVRAIKQKYDYNCGPTALLIVLKYQYGVSLTQNDMNLLTGVTEVGSSEFHLIRALDTLGFKYYEGSNGTLNKLRRFLQDGQVPMVHVVQKDGTGHFLVVTGIDEENIIFADPRNGKSVKYGLSFFLGVWREEEKETSTHWYLAVTGYTGDKFDSVINRYKRLKKKIQKFRS